MEWSTLKISNKVKLSDEVTMAIIFLVVQKNCIRSNTKDTQLSPYKGAAKSRVPSSENKPRRHLTFFTSK